MTHILRSSLLSLGVLVAAACLVAGATGASGPTPKPQRITLFSANRSGNDLPVAAEAVGPIHGVGTESQTVKPTATGQVNDVTLHFEGGTVRLIAPDHFAWKIDLPSCSATASGRGTWRITAGTGAYRGAVGHGTFTSHGVAVGARDRAGKCLGAKAQPAVNYVHVVLVGKVSLSP